MLSKVEKTEYSNSKEILLDDGYCIPVQVTHSGYLKAGAVLGGETSALQTRDTALTVVKDATAQGILRWDLREGETDGVMIVRGVVDSSKIDQFATNVPEEAQTALTHIIFRNGEY